MDGGNRSNTAGQYEPLSVSSHRTAILALQSLARKRKDQAEVHSLLQIVFRIYARTVARMLDILE